MTAGGTIKAVLALTVAAMTPLAAGAREELRRCEDAAGHVTYSNEACPTGTSRERTVENRPAVEVRRDGAGDNAAGHGGAIVPSARAAASATRHPSRKWTRKNTARWWRAATISCIASSTASRTFSPPPRASARRSNWASGACNRNTPASARPR